MLSCHQHFPFLSLGPFPQPGATVHSVMACHFPQGQGESNSCQPSVQGQQHAQWLLHFCGTSKCYQHTPVHCPIALPSWGLCYFILLSGQIPKWQDLVADQMPSESIPSKTPKWAGCVFNLCLSLVTKSCHQSFLQLHKPLIVHQHSWLNKLHGPMTLHPNSSIRKKPIKTKSVLNEVAARFSSLHLPLLSCPSIS